jgi:hypothetical protein
VEDYRLQLGDRGEMLSVIDRKGVRVVDFLSLRRGERRRWMELELAILEADDQGVRLDLRLAPGSTCFGAGNYLQLRTGLRIELPRGRRITLETVDPATGEIRASLEGDGMVAQRVLLPQGRVHLFGIDCRYRPEPSDPSIGLVVAED